MRLLSEKGEKKTTHSVYYYNTLKFSFKKKGFSFRSFRIFYLSMEIFHDGMAAADNVKIKPILSWPAF